MRVLFSLLLLSCVAAAAKEYRGAQFIAFTNFHNFKATEGKNEVVLVSPKIEAAIGWDELVLSWNFRGHPQLGLEVEGRAIYLDGETKWYHLGRWTLEAADYPRESVRGQRDEDGAVHTDVLKLKEKARAVQVRITVRGTNEVGGLKFLGLALCDSEVAGEAATGFIANKEGWGKTLRVPEQSQMAFEEGGEWCSPTAVAMMLWYWAEKLSRPELRHSVPEVARGVNDPNWPGTGNWSFNMAFAGSHNDIRAYVARLTDVSELEDWIAAGVPVAVSVRYGILKGADDPGNGHLVVCVGFDQEGNVIVNDPGRTEVRQTYSRENLMKAWALSENTVYLIYPENWKVPEDRFGHWE